MNLEELLLNPVGEAAADARKNDYPMTPLMKAALAEQLKEKTAIFNNRHAFKPGDLIQWKPGLKNRKYPKPGGVAIVQEVYDRATAKRSHDETGSPYYCDMLDIVVGVLVSDGEFMHFPMDSARFEPAVIEPIVEQADAPAAAEESLEA